MRSILAATLLALALGVSPALAKQGGCLKYGAAGAVAGHMVGSGHGVAGAAAGCALGLHERHKAEKQDAAPQQPANPQSQRQDAPAH
ncbi:hypothetical protein [Roseicella frigidaeris]|uniref:Glycine zipper 2TM domain-containing protein n=1 Tax=Roseicella frigidaeris TaxID=2230885 RepID=A0A327MHH0_9PROT|nr:hypothetical protein [Roseicella frigidaeris]RAI59638.1 hypothetical protein DOO78_08595 [Roseicella frigidaeris]